MSKVLVLGGSFAGLTGALEARRMLGKEHEVTLISKTENFVFIPSLIWVPFGRRQTEQITIPIAPVLEKKGVNFVHAEALKIDPANKTVETSSGTHSYDYLLVATGVEIRFDVIKGLGPHGGHTYSICTPNHALQAKEAWEKFVQDPGPVVVGAVQNASCIGAAYEFLFNLEYYLRKRGVRKQSPLTWISPEPFLGHFGIGGIVGGESLLKMFMKIFHIRPITNGSVKEVKQNEIVMENGETLPFKYSMLIPPFTGAKVVENSGIGNAKAFIETDDGYKSKQHPEIFAAGLAVHVNPLPTPVGVGVPKTGYPSDVSAKIAAENIVAAIKGSKRYKTKSMGRIPGLCMMDAGRKEVLIISNSLMKPRWFAMMIPNPFNDLTKFLFEKYFLWKTRNGLSYLP